MGEAETMTERATVERLKVAPDKDAFLAAFAAKGCTTEPDRCALVGMHRKSLWRYMQGEVTPSLPMARQIADRLDRDVDELWPAA